jgi:outer membrane protein assembly factor BamB
LQILKNRKLAITTVVILILAMSAPIILSPTANAHPMPGWTFVSYPYLVASPNPVGVGQTVAVVMWIDDPLPSATVTNDIRRHDYTLTITAPNGNVDTKHWDIVSDSTSVQYMQYTPDQIGNYTLKFDYPAQVYTWSGTYQNDTFLAATKTITLQVQQEPLAASKDSYPLPTEYWTRPIEGQNTYWFTLASNWLAGPFIIGSGAGYGIPGAYQPDGAAPNSAHVMWTKPIQYGGVVGGNDTAVQGEAFYSGLSYNTRFANPIIMYGTLYYAEPWGNGAGGGDYVAVNLQTGQELWRVNTTATGVSLVPSFGYLYSYESPNQHGNLPNGLLIATSGTTWRAYDARTGVLTTMNITNVPSGTSMPGPSGEVLRFTLTNLGNTTVPNYYLTEWNSSRVFGGGSGLSPATWYSGTANASLASCYDWNVSLTLPKGTWSIGTAGQGAIPLIAVNMILLTQGTFGGHPGDYLATVSTDPGNITAINIKADTTGKASGNMLWTSTYQPAPGNNSRVITDWDITNGVFVFEDKETFLHYGYSLTDGSYLWGPTQITNDFTMDYNYMAQCLERIAYGKLYVSGYSGILYAYDDKTGDLLWTYGNGGAGNSTLSGFVTPYGRYPIFISTIADGKVYLSTTEHSPNSPLYKDAQFRGINATDGTELWSVMNYGDNMYGGQAPVADGYLTTLNSYDSQIYSFGKGPSALIVTAPDLAASAGQAVVIRGTVTDIAAGTKQTEQAARFPQGVPAVSEASQSSWMEYVYMQKPRPTDVTGVPVSIDVVDNNGNFRNIGTTTSDANGVFSYTWTPDISGSYSVIATFTGSESYYPSHAETSFTVAAAAPTASPYPVTTIPSNDMFFAASTIAIIIAIAIATVVIIKKK